MGIQMNIRNPEAFPLRSLALAVGGMPEREYRLLEIRWTQDEPAEQGMYWLWECDPDSAPIPVSVLWSGTEQRCFLSSGQWGWNRHRDMDEMQGAWWARLHEPATPTNESGDPNEI